MKHVNPSRHRAAVGWRDWVVAVVLAAMRDPPTDEVIERVRRKVLP